MDIGEATSRMSFAVAVGRDLFVEIAKLRAVRLCWARVVAACGGDASAQRMHLHARGSWRERTRVDPWVGLLRGTGETFAAAVGGADTIVTTAMDAALGEPGPLGRRLALNTQIILAEESQLGRVADPAGGSGHVEALTDQLARAAWARFQGIEAAGGMVAALRSGLVQADAAASAQAQEKAAASVRLRSSASVASRPRRSARAGACDRCEACEGHRGRARAGEAAGRARLAAPFEVLRDNFETRAGRPGGGR